jgi:hypothetical protein
VPKAKGNRTFRCRSRKDRDSTMTGSGPGQIGLLPVNLSHSETYASGKGLIVRHFQKSGKGIYRLPEKM